MGVVPGFRSIIVPKGSESGRVRNEGVVKLDEEGEAQMREEKIYLLKCLLELWGEQNNIKGSECPLPLHESPVHHAAEMMYSFQFRSEKFS